MSDGTTPAPAGTTGGETPPVTTASEQLNTPPVTPPATPPDGTPPPEGTPPAGDPPATPPAAKPESWYHGLNEELTGVVEAKQWGSLEDALTSYRNLEKLHGVPAEQLLKLPEKAEDEGWAEVHKRLGVPENAEDYKLPVPEGDDGAYAKIMQEWFHEAHIPLDAARKIAELNNSRIAKQIEDGNAAYQVSVKEDTAALQRDLGAAYEDKMNVAKGVFKAMELTKEQVDGMEQAMGYGPLMKFLMKVGERMGESNFISGGGGGGEGGPVTPNAALTEITALKADPEFRAKIASGDADAKQRLENLHKMAYRGDEVFQ